MEAPFCDEATGTNNGRDSALGCTRGEGDRATVRCRDHFQRCLRDRLDAHEEVVIDAVQFRPAGEAEADTRKAVSGNPETPLLSLVCYFVPDY
jgi:hypothetical protein